MRGQRGVVYLIPLLVLTIIAVITTGLLLVYKGVVKNPVSSVIKIPTEAKVELKADYKNPLSKETQYINPFSGYKNPFDFLK